MKVSVVRCNSYKNQEVRTAFENSLKNLNFNFKKNISVLIKPNILGPFPPEKAITTNPAIIEELCKILKKHNATIYIGESSGVETKKSFQVSGISDLSKYGRIINFEGCEKKFVDFSSIKKVPIPRILNEVDLIINVPKLKTHSFTGATLSVKNLYGCIPGRIKSFYHKNFPLPKKFSEFLLELHEKINPQLNIIDGVIGLEGLGPGTAGIPINSRILVSGTSAVATDIIASEIMGFKPDSIYTNQLSGVKRESIEIIGEKMKLNFKKPASAYSFTTSIFHQINNLFPKPKIAFSYDECTQCHLCEKNCPVNAISLSPYPVCSHKNCIRCGCCIEVCPNAAIDFKDHLSKRLARSIYRNIFK